MHASSGRPSLAPTSPLALALQAERHGAWQEAAAFYREAERHEPNDHRLPTNRAHALWLADDPLPALAAAGRAVELEPRAALPRRNLGNILRDLNRFEAAETAYATAMHLEGQRDPLTAWNRSQTLIGLQRYDQAYTLAERRLELEAFEPWRDGPSWQGWQPWSGGRQRQPVQIWSEQGLGDTLQYVRWIPLLLRRGHPVQLVVEACLCSLLQEGLGWAGAGLEVQSKEALTGVNAGGPPCHGSLLSLPWRLGGAPATTAEPYLHSPLWRPRRPPGGSELRVGLVWASGRKLEEPFMAREYERRTLPAPHLVALLEGLQACAERQGRSLRLESLQLGEDRQLAAGWRGRFAAELPGNAGFAATARHIAGLDLVISVDTAAAHLVGAMGHPGWVLLPWGSDPRWLRQCGSSPWYPSLRLLRQPAHRDWAGLVALVLRQFGDWLAQPRGC